MSSARSSKPKLLILTSTYPRWRDDSEPGFVHELAKRLVDCFEVTVLCPHAPGALANENVDGVEVVRYRYAPAVWETLVNDGGIVTNLRCDRWKLLLVPGFLLAQAWYAWRLSRKRRIALVHAHWLIPQGLIAAFLRIPFVVTSHGADLYALRGAWFDVLKRFVLRYATTATVVSSAMLNKLEAIGAAAGKVSVISMGVDCVGRFTPDATCIREPDEILFVGRLVEKKGVAYLIRAMPTILRTRPDARLTIVGFGPDDTRLRAIVNDLGLAANVCFRGALPQAELPALYRRAALFVAPFVRAESGDQEGLPVSLMEAIACACPTIAGDVAGLRDVLGAWTKEFVVDPRDTEKLAALALERLSDPQRSAEQIAAVRAHLLETLDWECVAARYGAVLTGALPKKAEPA